jgi:hypothetical protein
MQIFENFHFHQLDFTSMSMMIVICIMGLLFVPGHTVNRKKDLRMPIVFTHDSRHSHTAGMLRHDTNHHHPRFVNLMELMDPLESRKIDAIVDQPNLIDEVNYLRSYAVEECRQLVCSTDGKKRFSACAASLLSSEKQCRPDCEDHLQMWVIHRCYLIETFDCDGNIGPNSVTTNTLIFNREGPQTLTEFTASINNLFGSKGITCNCCDYSNIVVVKDAYRISHLLFSLLTVGILAILV